ncbi:DNA polymerase Y family protein, partial [Novipirellula sp.]|uniref:Y-family DNA polymerase n=1 Tax=Novipirellula sp. TaxID=2795430 RepID=UPI00356B23B6
AANTEPAKDPKVPDRSAIKTSNVVDRSAITTNAPTLLWADDPRRGRIVVACCPRASMLGVRLAMPLVETTPLLQHHQSSSEKASPHTVAADIRPHDPFIDREMLKQLSYQIQQSITPRVAIETLDDQPWAGFPRHQPESLLCDITGVEHLFGDEHGLIAAVQNLLTCHLDVPLHARIAIAPNLAAAWAIAHFGQYEAQTTDEPTAAIASFPIESLRLARETTMTLHRLGVERVDQLLRLPRGGLATRLGKPLVQRISQAIGEIDEPLVTDLAPDELTYSHELEYPTRDLPILLHRMEGLLQQAKSGLAKRKLGALRLLCNLDFSKPPSKHIEIGLFAPSQDVKHLSSLVAMRFENLSLRHDVTRLSLSVALTGPLRSVQVSLLSEGPVDSHTLGGTAVSRFVDKLSGRLGRDAVLRVKLNDDPLPENAHRALPMTGQPVKSRRVSKRSINSSPSSLTNSHRSASRYRTPSPEQALRRPLTILDPPQPLSPVVPVTSTQVPESFRLRGRETRVVGYWGPERIETRWWSGPAVRRDYYRVETDCGTWWWIYRDISSRDQPQWFLHGQFT